MGDMARRISKTDVNDLIKILNEAYAEEWLAYYQYFLGAKLAQGILRPDIVKEFEEHAKEELDHAQKLAKRIIELGGTPVLSPAEWYKQSTCGYLEPKNHEASNILKQNLQGERCAIEVYNKLLKYVFGKDLITSHIVRQILQEEIEHEQELEDLAADYEVVLPNIACKCKKK